MTVMPFSFKVLMIIFAVVGAMWPVWPIKAQEPAHLYLQNVPLQDEQLLVVNVQLENVVDLYGAEFQLKFDPAQLRVRDDNPRLEGVQIAPGPLLAFDDRFVATNRVNRQVGEINFAFTLLRPAAPISQQGVLATVVFEILGDGPYTVEVSNVQLVSSDSQRLPVVAESLYLEKSADAPIIPEPEVLTTAGWIWWLSLATLLLLIGLVVLLVRVRLRQTRLPEKGIKPASTRHSPAMSRSSTMSAALLTHQAQHLLEEGDRRAAYELFSQAVELEPDNVEAWLGKGLVAEREVERNICFQRVLALDPDNDIVKRELSQ
jgi:hypothetical protein